MIRTFCPQCRTPFDVDSGLVGQKGLCSHCGSKFLITRPISGTQRAEDAQATQPLLQEISAEPKTTAPAPKAGFGSALVILIGAATAAAAWWQQTQPKPTEWETWLSFAGELHPLVLHFPIVLLLMTAFLLMIRAEQRRTFLALLWIAFLGACLAILAGLCSATDRARIVWFDFSNDLNAHAISGALTGVVAMAMLFFYLRGKRGAYLIAQWLGVASVLVAGHFGANMTHGDIWKKFPFFKVTQQQAKSPTGLVDPNPATNNPAAAVATVFDSVVQPMLTEKCVKCHGAEKAKGDLRLDSYQALLLAGESALPSILPGNVAQSESLRRIALPTTDDEHMPPEDKPQMTPQEMQILTWWVQAGASATQKVDDAAIPAEIRTLLKK